MNGESYQSYPGSCDYHGHRPSKRQHLAINDRVHSLSCGLVVSCLSSPDDGVLEDRMVENAENDARVGLGEVLEAEKPGFLGEEWGERYIRLS